MASGPEKQGPGERGRSRKLQEGAIYAYRVKITDWELEWGCKLGIRPWLYPSLDHSLAVWEEKRYAWYDWLQLCEYFCKSVSFTSVHMDDIQIKYSRSKLLTCTRPHSGCNTFLSNQKCKLTILLSSVISAVGLQEGRPSHLWVFLCLLKMASSTNTTAVPVKMKWRGVNRNSRTLEAGSHSIDKSHMNEKAFSNLLPFDDTEVNWMYTYRFYRPIPNVNWFPFFFLAIVTHAQAVDTKPSFLLPRGLGTMLVVPMHVNSLACKISLWTFSDTCMR